MTIHVTPIPSTIELAAPAFTLGVANAAGAALTAVSSNSTLLTFDTTVPDAITFGQSGSVGSVSTVSRRDHSHAMESETVTAAATQAEMEAASSTTIMVTPGRTQFHPAVCKAYAFTTSFSGIHTGSYNVVSFAKVTSGVGTWTWGTDFADDDYSVAMGGVNDPGFIEEDDTSGKDEGTMVVYGWGADGTTANDTTHAVTAFGKQ